MYEEVVCWVLFEIGGWVGEVESFMGFIFWQQCRVELLSVLWMVEVLQNEFCYLMVFDLFFCILNLMDIICYDFFFVGLYCDVEGVYWFQEFVGSVDIDGV